MSSEASAPVVSNKRNQSDPRRDNAILKYDKESIAKITTIHTYPTPLSITSAKCCIGDHTSGTSEFYQLISMFIGIYAFMMKVSKSHYLLTKL